MKLTQTNFERMGYAEKTRYYLSHEMNTTQGKNHKDGPTLYAQSRFVNDWREAFREFADRLPIN